MFNRIEYKEKAKQTLSGHWGIPIAISLVYLLITAILNGPATIQQLVGYSTGEYSDGTSSLLGTILTLIITGIIELASASFYLVFVKNRDNANFNTFLSALTNCIKGILAALWMYLWTMLWALLLIVPGIVKAIAYSQMYFILAENPNCSVRKSMRISMAITRGHKGDLFLMYLSFIGWGILCALSLGIGMLWLRPYMSASMTNAYIAMKDEALREGKVIQSDFENNSYQNTNYTNNSNTSNNSNNNGEL